MISPPEIGWSWVSLAFSERTKPSHERYFQAAWNGSFTAASGLDDDHGILYYDGFIDPGAFELLLGGVSHITQKALVLIAGPSASRWWWMEEECKAGEGEEREVCLNNNCKRQSTESRFVLYGRRELFKFKSSFYLIWDKKIFLNKAEG